MKKWEKWERNFNFSFFIFILFLFYSNKKIRECYKSSPTPPTFHLFSKKGGGKSEKAHRLFQISRHVFKSTHCSI